MATLEGRGFVNKLEVKQSAKGANYAKFDLAVQQKYRGKDGVEVKETLYWRCADFDPKDLPAEGDYVGVTGYATFTKWDGGKTGKGGVNVEVTVKSYEKLPQRDAATRQPATAPRAASADAAPPSDPFALSPGKP